ncbi:MAG TPA: hypothetical protein DCS28_02365 [Candidatus Moranbacteria bacterium]|nr:hypothetical protein [Candidatus Moranbacteria bacterium]HAT74858.1 hypothetical protein [Candidatus Moranbacteria bacterium]
MLIGIDASRAFIKQRTGIEEYSYQIIKALKNKLADRSVVLYARKNQIIDFVLPKNWQVKVINFSYLWTQVGLSLEMLFHPVDALFIPAHTVPFVHSNNTTVTIHGLEYEMIPEAYFFWERMYMRWSIKNSCRWAKKIIAVSENTKRDLMRLYKVPEEKIEVVHNGYDAGANFQFPISNFQKNSKFILFIGRLEKRKNILGIIKAFEILKEKYKIPHKLILAGNFGYGEEEIKNKIEKSEYKKGIALAGFVTDEEKWRLLKNADVFLFPTFYEGFGLPILEAQSAGAPVITSNISSLPEVADGSAFLIDPNNYDEIAEAAYKIISDKNLRNDIIKKGFENVKRFSWEKCASEIARILMEE